MKPKVLILDEPTAGLDPYGKEQILALISHLKEKSSSTIIVISHDIDEITRFATRLIVFNDGEIAFDIPMKELFKHREELVKMGLDIPLAVQIANSLREKGVAVSDDIVTIQDLLREIARIYEEKNGVTLDKGAIDKREFEFDFEGGQGE